ncbi:hypothetical protein [Streptomyces sp. NPDC002078]
MSGWDSSAVPVPSTPSPDTTRSIWILAGEELPRSRSHFWYVGLELLKVIALIARGVGLLTV